MFSVRRVNPRLVSQSFTKAMSSSQQQSSVRFEYSAGEDEEQLGRNAVALTTEGGGRWKVTDDNRGLERTFRFKTFKATWVCEERTLLGNKTWYTASQASIWAFPSRTVVLSVQYWNDC